jgi:uncharacterized repeat protein (TIGR01451 family)
MHNPSFFHQGTEKMYRSPSRWGCLSLTMMAALAIAAGWSFPSGSALAQTPQAPTVLYAEDFENGPDSTIQLLTAYTSTTGVTYTAAASWLTACNGQILSGATLQSQQPVSNCTLKSALEDQDAFNTVRQLAWALGIFSGTDTNSMMWNQTSNRAVTAYTDGANPGIAIEFATVNQIVLPPTTNSRFVTFGVDAASASCWSNSAPNYDFNLITSTGTAISAGTTGALCTNVYTNNVIDVPGVQCTPGANGCPANGLGGAGNDYLAKRLQSPTPILFNGATLGIRMTNLNGSGTGNDAAFDNIQVLDVTPSLYKAFSPNPAGTNQPTTLTFTIVNTTELSAKQNWGFVDTLPTGVLVASSPSPVNSGCGNAVITATAGGNTITVSGGDLAAGQTSCTISVNVVAAVEGSYTNGASNVATTGLVPPPDATLVIRNPRLTLRKISVGGVDSFGFSGTNGVQTQTLTTATAGTPVSGAVQILTAASTVTAITESTSPITYRVTDITCTGLGTGGAATPDLANRTISLNAAATAAGSNIVCTFTNTLQQTDIQVLKTASPDPVLSGNVITYSLVVSNNGPNAATNVLLSDTPAAGQNCSVPSTTATCTASGGASCPSPTVPVSTLLGSGITIPTLPVGGQVTVTLQCTVTASGL